MKKIVAMVVISLAGVGSCLAETFDSVKDGYTYTPMLWKNVASQEPSGPRYNTQIASSRPQLVSHITAKSDNVVAVRTPFVPVIAHGADDKDILGEKVSKKPSPTFSPVAKIGDQNIGQVDLGVTDLTANPYTIKSFRVRTDVIIASKTENKVVESDVVGFSPLDADGTLMVRIKTLDFDVKQSELHVTVAYKRSDAGIEGAFLDSVYAVDSKGKDIAGGRWDGKGGQPFGQEGTLVFIFRLDDKRAVGKTYRLVAVTKNVQESVEFDLRDIFQK